MIPDEIMIWVENLGKKYRIGGATSRYHTFRETITEGVSKTFQGMFRSQMQEGNSQREIWALRNLSFELSRGEVLGVIGRNGAGKTTLLKILSRITRPTEGHAKVRGCMGSLLEVGTGFHPELTGRENVLLNGVILGMSAAEVRAKFDEIVAFAEIEKFIDTPIKRYSTGMATRLAFSVAAHLEPEILAIDEVLAVGDLAFRQRCMGKMQDVSRAGRTILFVSHDMNAVRRLCGKCLWLESGKIVALGDTRDVVAKYEKTVGEQNNSRSSRVERGGNVHPGHKRFSWVQLSADAAHPSDTFALGDSLRLTLGMEGNIPHRSHFVEWFLNETNGGNRVAWGATHALDGDVAGNEREITFLIGPLPLTQGRYSFSFAMGVSGVISLDSWQDAISFDVADADPNGSGYHYSANYAPTLIPYRIDGRKAQPA